MQRAAYPPGRSIKCATRSPGGTKVPATGAFLRVPGPGADGRMVDVPRIWQESPVHGSGAPAVGPGAATSPRRGSRLWDSVRGSGQSPRAAPPFQAPYSTGVGGHRPTGTEPFFVPGSGFARVPGACPRTRPRSGRPAARVRERREPVRVSGRALGLAGGSGGIRTHGEVAPTHAFEACSFGRSDTLPRGTLPDGWRGNEIRVRGRLRGPVSAGCRRRRGAARRIPRPGHPGSPRGGG